MLEHALEYAALGMRVLPLHRIMPDGTCSCGLAGCASPGKHPMTRTGVKSATTDEAMIRRWWEAAPDANIGIATGAESGIFVIDVDEKSGGYDSLAELCAKYGEINGTWYAETGGGGLHFYFSHPGGAVKNKVGVMRGIDIRGDGGYVVAPPSNHKSGRPYKWAVEPGLNELLPLPEEWEKFLRSQGAFGDAPQQAEFRQPEPVPEKIAEGGRNDALYKMACSMRAKGFGESEIFGALKEANARRCVPPLDEQELTALVQSACKHPAGTSLNLQFEKAVEQPKPEKPRVEFKPYKVNTLDPSTFPEIEFIWQDILPTGLCLLVGPPKFGKSFMSLGLANAVSRGEPYLGHETTVGDVLYMALEDRPSRIWKRLNKIDPRPATDELEAVHDAPRIGPELMEDISNWVKTHERPRLVIVDIMGKIRNNAKKNETSYQFDTNELGELKRFADDNNICVLLIHHNTKQKELVDIFDSTSGTQAINGAMDAILILTGERRSAAVTDARLEVTGRDSEAFTLHLLFEDLVWRAIGDATGPMERDPVIRGLVKWWQAEGPFTWKGSAADLKLKLMYYEVPDNVSGVGIGKALASHRPMLRSKYGLDVQDSRSSKSRSWTISPFQPAFQETEEEIPPEFL